MWKIPLQQSSAEILSRQQDSHGGAFLQRNVDDKIGHKLQKHMGKPEKVL